MCQECPQPERGFSKNYLIDTRAILGGRTKNNYAAVISLTCGFVNLCLRRIILILILLVSLIPSLYFGIVDFLLHKGILDVCNINIYLSIYL